MDGIVVGVAQISFSQNLSGIATENSVPNFFSKVSSIMSASENLFPTPEESNNISIQEENSSFNDSSVNEINNDSAWEEIDDDLLNKSGYTLAERRRMPTRAAKESCFLGIKRRTIMKPAKRVKSHEDFKNLKPSEIKKIYMNKKLTNFKPSSLETIYEEAPTTHNSDESLNRLMGGRKLRRSLSLSDGFRYSKTLVSKRRAKIKKNFGKKLALKKISLEEFISKLNSSIEKNENESSAGCSMDDHKSVISQEQSKMFQTNTTENFDDTRSLSSSSLLDSNMMSP